MIYPSSQKPPIWSIDPGVIAYNCQKAGMPVPVLTTPFWEGAGDLVRDYSGRGNHGTINGSPIWGNGLDFVGNEADYVELEDMQEWTEAVTDFSIVTDTTWGSATVDETIIDFANLVAGNWYENVIILYRDDTGSARNDVVSFFISVGGAFTRVESQAGIATDGANNNIVATLGGGNMRLYIGGVEDPNSPVAKAATSATLDQPPWIGKSHSAAASQKPHQGNIKYLYFYNVCLSANQAKFISENPYFMYQIPEELYGYVATGGVLRELSTTIASTTTLSSASANILREMTTSVDATTATTAKLIILREMSSAIASATSTSSISANILREIQSAIASSTATATSDLLLLREISATLSATTVTSTPTFNILRELDTSVSATTSLSQIELLIAVLRELSTTIATTTSTSASELNILRELTSIISVTTSLSQIILSAAGGIDTENKRRSAMSLPYDIIYPVPDGNIGSRDRRHAAGFYQGLGGGTFELSAAIAAATATSSISTDILRELTSAVAVTTLLSQIELLIGVLRELSTTIAASTTTSASEINVLREIVTLMDTQTASAASINVLRELQSAVAAGTSLSQIELIIGALIELSTTIAVSTTTSVANFNVLREFTTTISATTSTSDITILMVRALSAQIAAGTDVGAATMLVLREFSTSVDAVALTSSIELLLVAAQIIVDTQIQPITPERMATPFTPKRLISST